MAWQSKATKINTPKKDIVPLTLIFRAQDILINYPQFLRVKDRCAEVPTEFGTSSHISLTGQVLPLSEENLMSRSYLTPSHLPPPHEAYPQWNYFKIVWKHLYREHKIILTLFKFLNHDHPCGNGHIVGRVLLWVCWCNYRHKMVPITGVYLYITTANQFSSSIHMS